MNTYFYKDAPIKKLHGLAKSPKEYEQMIVIMCEDNNYIFNGFIGDWKGSKTRISLTCSNGHIYETTITSFFQGKRCLRCANSNRNPINEHKARNTINERTDYKFIEFVGGKYIGSTKTKLRVMCDMGHVYETSYISYISGKKCAKCCHDKNGQKKRIKENELLNRLSASTDDTVLYIESNNDKRTSNLLVTLMCKEGHIYHRKVSNVTTKKCRCEFCYGGIRRNENEAIKEIIDKKGEYIFLGFVGGKYKGTTTRLNIRCDKGHDYTVSFSSFIKGTKCAHCQGVTLKTEESAVDEIKSVAKEHKFLGFVGGKYNGCMKTKIELICPNDHVYQSTYNNFVSNGNRCPHCANFGYSTIISGCLYIQKLIYKNSFVGVKFGITNKDVEKRMKQQSRVSKFDHEVFYELTLQDGQKILDLENKIKEAMKGKTSYISKEDMPDGYTETVAPSELSTIMYIVKSFEKELTA